MAENNGKFIKIGELRKSKKGKQYIALGSENPDPQKTKYNFEVQLLVKDAKGDKVAVVKNPTLFFADPRREREDGSVPNIPDFILDNIGFILETKE